jgi:hypothetical protein
MRAVEANACSGTTPPTPNIIPLSLHLVCNMSSFGWSSCACLQMTPRASLTSSFRTTAVATYFVMLCVRVCAFQLTPANHACNAAPLHTLTHSSFTTTTLWLSTHMARKRRSSRIWRTTTRRGSWPCVCILRASPAHTHARTHTRAHRSHFSSRL